MEKPQLDTLLEIYHDQITPPEEAMRQDMDRDELELLANSIKANGLLEPIILRWHNDRLEIVAGHRRFVANGMIGNSKIKCIVREMTDDEMMTQRAHENLIRSNIDPVEEAVYIAKLVGEDETKVPAVAKMLGYSESWVSDRLNILTYPDYFIGPLKAGKITLGVAKALAQIEDESYRKMFFDEAVRNGMRQWQADHVLNQYLEGVFKPGVDINPTDVIPETREKVIIRQRCAACGGIAETPNLESVFCHIKCPTEPGEKT